MISTKGHIYCTQKLRAYFGVCVFNPLAPSNTMYSIPAMYKRHKHEKSMIMVHGSEKWSTAVSTPLFSLQQVGWGMKQWFFTIKWLASLISSKCQNPYSSVLTWIRCSLSFALLCSSIRCIRGYRSKCGYPVRVRLSPPVDMVRSESVLNNVSFWLTFIFIFISMSHPWYMLIHLK